MFDVVEQLLDARGVAGDHVRAHQCEGQDGAIGEHLAGEGVEPRLLGGLLASLSQVGDGQLHELGRLGEVLGGHGVADRLGPVTRRLEPLAGSAVQRGDPVGLLVGEAGSQHIAEEVVVPVPLSALVEGDEEQVGPFEGFQSRLRVAAARHRGAQRSREAAQDRGLEEEGPDVVALPVQDFVHEVVDDEAVVAGEFGDERRGVVAASAGQGGKLQGRDPAFGTGFEGLHVRGGEIESHRVVQVGRRLLGGEAQIGRPDLEELAPSPQAGERPRWVGPAGDDEVELFREVLDQEDHRLVHCEGLDHVVVVQHEDDLLGECGEVVEQAGDDRFQRRRGGLQRAQCVGADIGGDLAHGGDDVGPEHRRVAVTPVERQPRRGVRLDGAGGEPLRQ